MTPDANHPLDAARRRWWITVPAAVVGGGVMALVVLAVPPVWSAQARVDYGVLAPGALVDTRPSSTTDQAMASQVQLVTSDSVLREATRRRAREGGSDVRLRRADISVSTSPGTTVLQITARAPSATAAQAGASAVARSYVAYQRDRARADLADSAGALRTSLDRLRTRIAAARILGRAPEVRSLVPVLDDLRLQQLLFAAASRSDAGPARLVLAAPRPAATASLSMPVAAVLGIAAGVLLGLLLAVWWGRRLPPRPRRVQA